jgi:hypothetical protein
VNHDTAEFLKTQIKEKTEPRKLARKMNREEFLYNKGILLNVNEKLKTYEGSSQNPLSSRNVTPPSRRD